MRKSDVTEYIVSYIQQHDLSSSYISNQTGVAENKLCYEYKEPLLADEFLRVCVFLHLSPEKIRDEIYHA